MSYLKVAQLLLQIKKNGSQATLIELSMQEIWRNKEPWSRPFFIWKITV